MSVGSATFRRSWLRRPRLRVRRRRIRLAVATAALAGVVLVGGWLLLRDSSLVSVDRVTVRGAAGADAAAIDRALVAAARRMTTLDVQSARLRAAVARFPDINGLQVSTHFPHGMVIEVDQALPVGLVEVDGRRVPVTGGGTLLASAVPHAALPLISLAVPPAGGRLTRPGAVAAARLLGAAPHQLLSRLSVVSWQGGHGLTAQLQNGPSLYFGQATQLAAKWAAAVAVLGDPSSAGASYVDLTDPARPVAGAGGGSSGGAGAPTASSGTAAPGTNGSPPGSPSTTG